LTGADTVSASFTAPLVGVSGATLVFELRADDGFPQDVPAPGYTFANAVDQVTIHVTNTNHAPVADAGADQTVDENTPVSLNGNASSDPDGNPLTYAWAQTGGPAVTLVSQFTSNAAFTAPFVSSAGADLTFELTVNDGFGGSA